MLNEYYCNKRWLLWAWGGALILLLSLYAQVYMSVLFNDWYGRFYNLFQPPFGTIDQFWSEFAWFIKIAAGWILHTKGTKISYVLFGMAILFLAIRIYKLIRRSTKMPRA